jgi:hypothetical protein
MNNGLRREQHDKQRRKREIAQRQGRPVDHDADQHDRDHDERTLRRDFRA